MNNLEKQAFIGKLRKLRKASKQIKKWDTERLVRQTDPEDIQSLKGLSKAEASKLRKAKKKQWKEMSPEEAKKIRGERKRLENVEMENLGKEKAFKGESLTKRRQEAKKRVGKEFEEVSKKSAKKDVRGQKMEDVKSGLIGTGVLAAPIIGYKSVTKKTGAKPTGNYQGGPVLSRSRRAQY